MKRAQYWDCLRVTALVRAEKAPVPRTGGWDKLQRHSVSARNEEHRSTLPLEPSVLEFERVMVLTGIETSRAMTSSGIIVRIPGFAMHRVVDRAPAHFPSDLQVPNSNESIPW